MKTKRIIVTKRKLDALMELWADHSVAEIAKKLGAKPNTIRSWAYQLRKRGVPLLRKPPSGSNVIDRFADGQKPRHNKRGRSLHKGAK